MVVENHGHPEDNIVETVNQPDCQCVHNKLLPSEVEG